eukprot:57400_1
MAPPLLPNWWETKHTILSAGVGVLVIVGIIVAVHFSGNADVDPTPSQPDQPKACAAAPTAQELPVGTKLVQPYIVSSMKVEIECESKKFVSLVSRKGQKPAKQHYMTCNGDGMGWAKPALSCVSKVCAAPTDDSILTDAGLRFVGFPADAKTTCKDATECAVVCKGKSSAFGPDKSGKVEKVVCKIVPSGPNVWVATDTNDCVSSTKQDTAGTWSDVDVRQFVSAEVEAGRFADSVRNLEPGANAMIPCADDLQYVSTNIITMEKVDLQFAKIQTLTPAESSPGRWNPLVKCDVVNETYGYDNHYVGQVDEDGRFYYGVGIDTMACGDRYSGQWARDRWSGIGEYVHKNGDVYLGKFKYNDYHGKGKYTDHSTGTSYSGEWVDDEMKGMVTITSTDGTSQQECSDIDTSSLHFRCV